MTARTNSRPPCVPAFWPEPTFATAATLLDHIAGAAAAVRWSCANLVRPRAIDRAVNWRRNDQKPARIAVNVTATAIPFPAIHFAVGNSSHEEVIAALSAAAPGKGIAHISGLAHCHPATSKNSHGRLFSKDTTDRSRRRSAASVEASAQRCLRDARSSRVSLA